MLDRRNHEDDMTSTVPPISIPGMTILNEIGRGAYSIVYRCQRNGIDYAVKVPHEAVATKKEASIALRKEAAALATLHHPGLLKIHELGEAISQPFLVMELFEVPTLDAVLQERGSLPAAEILRMAIDVAGALGVAHRAGLVHRDVKPTNIAYFPDGHAKVFDFGLVGQAGDDMKGAGTLLYSAPEKTRMLKRPVDGRSDLYSLGVVLFECAAGRPPFYSADAGELTVLHAQAPPPALSELRPDLPDAFGRMVARLLAKDPDDRYQTVVGLQVDLQRLARGERTFALGEEDHPGGEDDSIALVGRDEEIATMRDVWRYVQESVSGRVVVVSGAAGIGKSRLARELLAQAQEEGALTISATCPHETSIPLGPLRDAVDAALTNLSRQTASPWAQQRTKLQHRIQPYAGLLDGLSPALDSLIGHNTVSSSGGAEDQVYAAVASLFLDLAAVQNGAVLHVDDVQWMDHASLRVMGMLAGRLQEAPLLVIATARTDSESSERTKQFLTVLSRATVETIMLPGLVDSGINALIRGLFDEAEVDEKFVRQMAARSDGNPFAVIEYVRAVLDAGLLRPHWGKCFVDREGLDSLHLPDDVHDLIGARLHGLDMTTQALIGAGAVMGVTFPASIVAEACQLEPDQVAAALDEALRHRLIEWVGADQYCYVHNRVREVVLSRISDDQKRLLHQRIAEVLQRINSRDPVAVYAKARHYAAGTQGDLARVYSANADAGQTALGENVLHDALAFLDEAARAANIAHIAVDSDFLRLHGLALYRLGQYSDALRRLNGALNEESISVRRAQLLCDLAWTRFGLHDYVESLESANLGMKELGYACPTNPLLRGLLAAGSFTLGLLCGNLGFGRGKASGVKRDEYRIFAELTNVAGRATYICRSPRSVLAIGLRNLYPVSRLGISTETARVYSSLGLLASVLKMPRRSDKIFGRLLAMSDQLDPLTRAEVKADRAIAIYLRGKSLRSLELFRRLLVEEGHWLSAVSYNLAARFLVSNLHLQGHDRDAMHWYELMLRRMQDASGSAKAESVEQSEIERWMQHLYVTVVPTVLGGTVGQKKELFALKRAYEEFEEDPIERGHVANPLTQVYFEIGELGPPIDQTIAAFETVTSPGLTTHIDRHFWVVKSYVRLEQLRSAPEDLRLEARKRADMAIEQLGKVSTVDELIAGHHAVIQASLFQIGGDQKRARRLLDQADESSAVTDSPWIRFEIQRIRARLLVAQGQEGAGHREAEIALLLAEREGWVRRGHDVRQEFVLREEAGIHDPTSHRGSTDTRRTGGGTTAEKRQLEALLQLNAAASKELEPRKVVRVALDEIVRILGAERALLFLCEDDESPNLYSGRDFNGNDLVDLDNYASTIVERARRERNAVVVTGTEEGEALGSQSAVIHELRSIMASPLELEGQLLGVIYLDSTLAKGFFTTDDLDILIALSSTIAASIKTARAAQLELSIQGEQRERALAEALRDSMMELSAVAEPQTLLKKLLQILGDRLDCAVGCIWIKTAEQWNTAALLGAAEDGMPLAAEILLLDEVAQPGTRQVGESGHPAPLLTKGRYDRWVGLSFAPGGTPLGAIVLAGRLCEEAEIDVGAAIVEQGAVAYERARLFSQVQALSVTDELTGLHNRRHFFELAEQLFDTSERYQRPLAAVMADVDRFKSINDRFGHAVGDEVIREVASRLAQAVRGTDIVGRYGGEEFVLLLPETASEAETLAERARGSVADTPVHTAVGDLPVTISLGVALRNADFSVGALINRADTALYQAKNDGRNRVTCAQGSTADHGRRIAADRSR
jgi:diguanylate cyclase (GGDEF)-like protein